MRTDAELLEAAKKDPDAFGELDEPHTEGQLRVRALDPELVWLAHEHEPWRLRTV